MGRSFNGLIVSAIGVSTFFEPCRDGGATHANCTGDRTQRQTLEVEFLDRRPTLRPFVVFGIKRAVEVARLTVKLLLSARGASIFA